MGSFGDKLKREREMRAITLEEISDATKIGTRSLRARPGMTFSNEPGIYIRGEFGVRLEDDMVITPDGAKLFTPQSESLEKPF